MRLISIERVTGKEMIARSILDSTGRVLLSAGVKLQQSYANKLLEMGISEVYIEDSISEGIQIDEAVLLETRSEAKRLISTESKRLLHKNDINIMQIYKIVDLIINDILECKDSLANMKDLRIKSEVLFSHSVNTAVMGALLAKRMEYNYDKMHSIVAGCLLHDLGKVFLPSEILNKQESDMTSSERLLYRKHPQIGYDLLKDRPDIMPTVRVSILMHHENVDGSGFPNGYVDEKIHYAAKVCAVCNSYDKILNSADRAGILCTTEAIEYLTSCSGIYLDKEMVDAFLKYIPIYPVGCMVILNNGYVGIVVKNRESNLLRPIVRIFYDMKVKIKIKNREVDLMKELSFRIDREISSNILKDIEE